MRCARFQHRAPLHPPRRGLGPRLLRRHQGPLHRLGRREGAAASSATAAKAGSRPNTACCRAATHTRSDREAAQAASRAVARRRSSASSAVQPAQQCSTSEGAGRTHDLARLRRHPGRRRHPHRGHHRRLRRRARRRDLAAGAGQASRRPARSSTSWPPSRWASCEATPLLDLEYTEDSASDTDMNVVMTAAGGFVEVQGTAEGAPFTRADQMDAAAGRSPPRVSPNWSPCNAPHWRRHERAGPLPSAHPGARRAEGRPVKLVLASHNAKKLVRDCATLLGSAAHRTGPARRTGHRRSRGAACHLRRERAREGAPCGAGRRRGRDRRRLGPVRRRARRCAGRASRRTVRTGAVPAEGDRETLRQPLAGRRQQQPAAAAACKARPTAAAFVRQHAGGACAMPKTRNRSSPSAAGPA